MSIWVTGATGFIGQALVRRLLADGEPVVPVSRSAATVAGVAARRPEELGAALEPEDAVIYAAGLAHTRGASRAALFQANCEAPLALARQAAERGARRFVFLSSIKVNGDCSGEEAFRPDDMPRPGDDYGLSKWEGEQALWEYAHRLDMELTVVRPPLVYGPGVRANFAALVRWVARGWPLPLGSVSNRRSLVYRDNLVDLLALCVRHPAAADETFLVSDEQDLSTPALLRLIGEALGRPARLWPCPPRLLRAGAGLVGRPAVAARLCESLRVDTGLTSRRLGWRPPVSVEAGLQATVKEFK